MSSANLDLVRSIYAAWERGDFSEAEWADPEIEYEHADGPSPGTWTGLAGMSKGERYFLSAWEGFRVAAEEYRELDGERVLVLARYRGSGKKSGLQMRTTDENQGGRGYVSAPLCEDRGHRTGRGASSQGVRRAPVAWCWVRGCDRRAFLPVWGRRLRGWRWLAGPTVM